MPVQVEKESQCMTRAAVLVGWFIPMMDKLEAYLEQKRFTPSKLLLKKYPVKYRYILVSMGTFNLQLPWSWSVAASVTG